MEETQNLNQMAEGEGDLFGIRALEKGFYGGVAQSRPATSGSIRALVPPPPLALLSEGYARRFNGIAASSPLSQMPLCRVLSTVH